MKEYTVKVHDDYKAWYINGKYLTEAEFNAKMNPVELTMDQIAFIFGIPVSQLKIKK